MTDMKVLLMPVDDANPDFIVSSAIKIQADCGHECWIAETSRSQIALAQSEGQIVETECVPCSGMSTKELIEEANAGEIKAAPGAHQEINDHVGFNLVDLMSERLRIQEL